MSSRLSSWLVVHVVFWAANKAWLITLAHTSATAVDQLPTHSIINNVCLYDDFAQLTTGNKSGLYGLTWSMLLMKVWGWPHLGVSMTKRTTVGKVDAKDSVMICPEADHVKISIWPGVSATMYFGAGSLRFSQRPTTCTKNLEVLIVVGIEESFLKSYFRSTWYGTGVYVTLETCRNTLTVQHRMIWVATPFCILKFDLKMQLNL